MQLPDFILQRGSIDSAEQIIFTATQLLWSSLMYIEQFLKFYMYQFGQDNIFLVQTDKLFYECNNKNSRNLFIILRSDLFHITIKRKKQYTLSLNFRMSLQWFMGYCLQRDFSHLNDHNHNYWFEIYHIFLYYLINQLYVELTRRVIYFL